jgi:hypothetical protein
MPRRASSGINPGILIGVAAFVVVALVTGKFLVSGKSSPFTDAARFDVEQYMENANSMRGNEYVLEGRIDEKLRWTPDRGQLVSVRVDDEGDEGDAGVIGIEIPPQFNHLNIEREQRYAFKVRIRQGGIPVATAVERL